MHYYYKFPCSLLGELGKFLYTDMDYLIQEIFIDSWCQVPISCWKALQDILIKMIGEKYEYDFIYVSKAKSSIWIWLCVYDYILNI